MIPRSLPMSPLLRILALLLAVVPVLRAQWLTQPVELRPGWNAVQFHVDLSYAKLDTLIGSDASNPVEEVWLWTPAVGTAQFVQSPQVPTATISQWSSWKRALGPASELHSLPPNATCLVKLGAVGTNYTLRLKGRPVPPRNQWTATGLNFLGFPVVAGEGVAIDSFFNPAGDLLRELELYRYNTGELDAGNPARVFALRTTKLRRGEAYWVKAGEQFNRYFAPFEVVLQDPRGVVFGRRTGEQRIRLRNRSTRTVTVTLAMVSSEVAPSGQAAVVGEPPLLLRGAMNTTNLAFSHSAITKTNGGSWTLTPVGQPDSDIEVVLGLDRYVMGGNEGDVFAAILQFTDSLGLARLDIPVAAEAGSWSGLWIGDAEVTGVRHSLARYVRGTNGTTVLGPDGRPVRLESMDSLGPVARPFPVRVLVHVEGTNAFLLQRAYVGLDASTNRVVALREDLLGTSTLSSARRLSSVYFPWTATNQPWAFNGRFVRDGVVETRVLLPYNDHRSNPFLHTYHPDHDTLDAGFSQALPRGRESWDVSRLVRLRIRPPGTDFRSLTAASDRIDGAYEEVIDFLGSGSDSRTYDISGSLVLRRVSDVPVLTRN